MSGRVGASLLALALVLVACEGTQPATKSEAKAGAKGDAAAKPAGPAPAPVDPAGSPSAVGEDAVSHEEPGVAPAWFTPTIIPGATVNRQSQSKTPEGGTSSLLLLELAAGTTPEQCIAAAEAKLGETITALPEQTTTPQGYLTIMGQTETYHFNVVCGAAKGTPTMYLSYTVQPQESAQ